MHIPNADICLGFKSVLCIPEFNATYSDQNQLQHVGLVTLNLIKILMVKFLEFFENYSEKTGEPLL